MMPHAATRELCNMMPHASTVTCFLRIAVIGLHADQQLRTCQFSLLWCCLKGNQQFVLSWLLYLWERVKTSAVTWSLLCPLRAVIWTTRVCRSLGLSDDGACQMHVANCKSSQPVKLLPLSTVTTALKFSEMAQMNCRDHSVICCL